ncbi:Synchronized import protein 1 [Pleurostoma richardsiae]|uniref:Synchronized import protein 1 n=1 Tax=Pleurostoma richardsiae TaxID=41990 RepID=A0AA38R6P7_9PEZI|nr:Synchronized import protein 1 [Pleurostoma richardsiae]
MGKSRRNRGGHRSDPLAKPPKVLPPPTDPELATLREKNILPVLKDLKSPEPKSRTAAAAAISNIVQDEKCRKLLLREQIVHILLTETLTDISLESRAAGWAIMRTLAEEEESDFCVHLYRVDILTALEHACKNTIEALMASDPQFAKTPKAQQQFTWDIARSLSSLVGGLAVARDEILDAIIKREQIFRFLFTLVSSISVPTDVMEETLCCLMALSEDNLQVSQMILADQSHCFSSLMKLKPSDGFRAVLASAVLHNMFSALQWHDGSPGQDGATDAILVTLLSKILDQTKLDRSLGDDNASLAPVETLQLALEVLASIATDLQGSLEKGNRKEEEWTGFGDDDTAMDGVEEEQVEEGEDNSEESAEDEDGPDEMDEDEMEADMEKVTGGGNGADEELSGIDDLPTLRDLIQQAVPQLIRLATISPDSDEAVSVQSHALAALNNISWTISCIDFSEGENDGIFQAWAPVAKRIWSRVIAFTLAHDTADINLATAIASLAWAISRTLQGNTPVSGDDHQKFISLYQASKGSSASAAGGQDAEDPFQGLGVKCIGVLGQLARDPAPIPRNRDIGVFLVTLLSTLPEVPAADAVEALNQLFDIYGDENFACDKEVFWKDNFLKHLEEIMPKVKATVKTIDKRTAQELRNRADEAILNLHRFIQYKKKNMPK